MRISDWSSDVCSSDLKSVLTIDKSNMAQYADNLTAGTKALLERYPTFHADVYPTHRSVAFPTFVTDNTQVCATTAKLTRNGESMEGCHAGYPFPIPKTGDRKSTRLNSSH